MDLRNRIGLYGSYFLGVAGIGFTLPYLPIYLGQEGLSDRTISLVSALAALSGLAQFPVGLWSDRTGRRKPFLVVALALLVVSTLLMRGRHGVLWLGVMTVLFAENGVCRATVESLAGAEAAALASASGLGAALGALRFWKPLGIILVLGAGSVIAERWGVGAILVPLVLVQGLAVAAALLIHEGGGGRVARERPTGNWLPKDARLWAFLAAMVLFHTANAPGGVYLGLYLTRDLHAPDRLPAYAFVVSMVAWTLVVRPAGALADRWGRRPLLIAAWAMMSLRLAVVAAAQDPWQVVANQALDGAANGLFAVLAAAWVTDRLADPRRMGEAQVLVGTALVFGSALGPALSGLVVDALGYRRMFAVLAGVGAAATALVVACVPETLARHSESSPGREVEPMNVVTDLSTSP